MSDSNVTSKDSKKTISNESYIDKWQTQCLILFSVTIFARAISYYYVTLEPFSWINMFATRGVYADATITGILAIIAVKLKRIRTLYYCAGFLYSFALAANIENIHYNFANLSIHDTRFLAESEFMISSILSRELLSLWGTLFTAFIILHYAFTRKPRKKNTNTILLVLQCAAFIAFLFPVKVRRPMWQEYNVIEENIVRLADSEKEQRYKDSPKLRKEYSRFMKKDLSGTSILPNDRNTKPNVIMVVIEGLSEQFITPEIMPTLHQLASENIHYKNFVNHQRFTENGLYSMLCGDMPTLYKRTLLVWNKKTHKRYVFLSSKSSTNKWRVVAQKGTATPCLPKVLGKLGYKTAFFQASALSFSNKSGFMKHVGMKVRHSDKSLLKAYPKTKEEKKLGKIRGMGLADVAFYPRVVLKLKKINQKGKPWFATLMTTSTHYPLYIDKKIKNKLDYRMYEAFYTADMHLKNFIDSLKKEKLLDNTIFIVTGDESAARSKKHDNASILVNNWGALVIKTPVNTKLQSEEYFTQSDVMPSILDYMKQPKLILRGRSVFRTYDKFRPIMFGNIRTDHWYTWYKPNKLIFCANFFKKCDVMSKTGDLFNATFTEEPKDKKIISFYKDLAKKSDETNIYFYRKKKK